MFAVLSSSLAEARRIGVLKFASKLMFVKVSKVDS